MDRVQPEQHHHAADDGPSQQRARRLAARIHISLCSVFTNVTGGLYDYLASQNYIIAANLGAKFVETPGQKIYFDLNNTAMVRWLMVSSYVSFILTFVAIFHYFFASIQPFYELSTSHLWGQLFDYVMIINVTKVALYCVFPLIHIILHRFYRDPRGSQQQYARAFALSEFRFVLASALQRLR